MRGGSENLYTFNPKGGGEGGGGASKKLNHERGGLLKFQASNFKFKNLLNLNFNKMMNDDIFTPPPPSLSY